MSEKYIGNVAEVTSLDDVANFLIESTSQSIKKIPTETLKEGVYKDLPIDSELSDTSENTVKNKVIYKALEDKADVIINSASGTTVTTTDSAKVKPKNIKLFGKGKQRQYKGNQLFDAKTAFATQIETGIIAVNDDGSVTLNGTFNSTNRSFSITLQAGTYYFTESKNILHHFARGSDGYWNNSVVLEEETTFSGYINSDTYNNVTISPIIATSSDVELEPYVGNEPSPNMNYPQIPEFLGESGSIGGKVLGKNQLNPYMACTTAISGVNFVVNDDKTITVNGTATADINYSIAYFKTEPTARYRFTGTPLGGSEDTYYMQGGWFSADTGSGAYGGTTNGNKAYFGLFIKSGVTINNLTFKPMVRYEGFGDDTYEPYTEQPFTSLTPNGLRGIPLGQTIPDAIKNSPIHMSGVYWDKAEGQYYIGDTKNENGKDVQRIGKIIATSNSIIQDMSMYTGALPTVANFRFAGSGTKGIKSTRVMSEKLLGKPCWGNDYECCWHVETNGIDFNIKYEHLGITSDATKEERENAMKTWLGNNELAFYHILANPIITDTTNEEKSQLDALVMNYPNTTIVNDAGAYQEVTYIADTKNYIAKIEKKHEEDIQTLKNAILSLGGNV